jgi:hypothetical protein
VVAAGIGSVVAGLAQAYAGESATRDGVLVLRRAPSLEHAVGGESR